MTLRSEHFCLIKNCLLHASYMVRMRVLNNHTLLGNVSNLKAIVTMPSIFFCCDQSHASLLCFTFLSPRIPTTISIGERNQRIGAPDEIP